MRVSGSMPPLVHPRENTQTRLSLKISPEIPESALGRAPTLGRLRRCGGGLEPVPLQRSSPVRPAGSAAHARCPSQPGVPSPPLVEVLACALSLVLQGCGGGERPSGEG